MRAVVNFACQRPFARARGPAPSTHTARRACQADRVALAEVRAAQQRVRLEDDAAAEAVKEAARAAAENLLDRGLECLKRRTRVRDFSDALQVPPPGVHWIADFLCSCGAACSPHDFVRGRGSVLLWSLQCPPIAAWYAGSVPVVGEASQGVCKPGLWLHRPCNPANCGLMRLASVRAGCV